MGSRIPRGERAETRGDVLGPAVAEAPASDPRWGRWRAAARAFHETGSWGPEPWRELELLPADVALDPEPWAVIGDEAWRWEGGAWSRVDPEPARERTLRIGTVCHERRHHAMAAVDADHAICEDCGWCA